MEIDNTVVLNKSEPSMHEPPTTKRKEYKLLEMINDVVNLSPESHFYSRESP